MSIAFDSATGRLRCGVRVLETVVRAHADKQLAEFPKELADAGVVTGSGIHPALAASLDAMDDSECRLHLQVAGPGGSMTHRMWARPGGAASLLQVEDDVFEVLPLVAAFVPAAVLRVTRLGPRPRLPRGTVELPSDTFEALLSTDGAVRSESVDRLAAAVPSGWRDWAEVLREGSWRAWSVQVEPGSRAEGSAAATVSVVENARGLVAVSAAPDDLDGYAASTPSETWSALAALLPAVPEQTDGTTR